MKPLVGYTTYYVTSEEFDQKRVRGIFNQDMLMSTMDYSRALELAGMIPVAMPVLASDQDVYEMVQRMDAILLTGGGDIKPEFYSDGVLEGFGPSEELRDEHELRVIKHALNLGKPIFGICRGFQLLNIYFGGTLFQDINIHSDYELEHVRIDLPRYERIHHVTFKEGSIFKEIFEGEEIHINSFHHQAIKELGTGLVADGIASDGVIEAITHESYDKVFAVQWHPEMMLPSQLDQLKLFTYFRDLIKEDEREK